MGSEAPSQPKKALAAIYTARCGFAFAAGYFPAPPLGMLPGDQGGSCGQEPPWMPEKTLGKCSKGDQQDPTVTHLQLCGIPTLWKLLS